MMRIHAVGACVIVGCATAGPPRVDVVIPERWSNTPAASAAASAPSPDVLWDRFACDELRQLIEAARRQNLQSASAVARVAQQQALARVARAPLYPSLDVEANLGGQSDNSKNLGSLRGMYFEGGLAASYEVDLWGKNRGHAAAADSRVGASRYDRAGLEIEVIAAVADIYFEVLSLRERMARARDNLAATQGILAIVEAKAQAGAARASEVVQQKALVASEAARLDQCEQAEAQALVSLAIASGRQPNAIAVSGQGLDAVVDPSIEPSDVGAPARLLASRPDIARAEAELAATHADVEAARAALLPQLRINALAGFQSVFLAERELNGAGVVYAGSISLTQPIFDGGLGRAQREVASARQVEAEAQYRQTVLNALGEVEQALSALAGSRTQYERQRTVVDEARSAFELIEREYKAGAEELLTVIDAQRTLFRAQDELSQARLAKLRAAVALLRALGGNWPERGG